MKKKICIECGRLDYYFSKKRCKPCAQKSYAKPKAKKKYISPISKSQANKLADYRKKRDKFLKENPKCWKCGKEGTTLHHAKGRVGDNLTDVSTFVALCLPCHTWVEEHPLEAKKLGYSKNRL